MRSAWFMKSGFPAQVGRGKERDKVYDQLLVLELTCRSSSSLSNEPVATMEEGIGLSDARFEWIKRLRIRITAITRNIWETSITSILFSAKHALKIARILHRNLRWQPGPQPGCWGILPRLRCYTHMLLSVLPAWLRNPAALSQKAVGPT